MTPVRISEPKRRERNALLPPEILNVRDDSLRIYLRKTGMRIERKMRDSQSMRIIVKKGIARAVQM